MDIRRSGVQPIESFQRILKQDLDLGKVGGTKMAGVAVGVAEHELIRNVIALYSQCLDAKDWAGLERVLTSDVSVEYPAPLQTFHGIPACHAGIKKAISHLSTFHALSTQSIELTGPQTAIATTYVSAQHYIDDRFFIAPGKYEDELVKIRAGEGEEWRIRRRVVSVMGIPQGEWSLLH